MSRGIPEHCTREKRLFSCEDEIYTAAWTMKYGTKPVTVTREDQEEASRPTQHLDHRKLASIYLLPRISRPELSQDEDPES